MNFLTTTSLNVFTSNTKAKSSEVNANFLTIKDYLSSFSYDAKHGTIALQTSSKSADYIVTDIDGINCILMTTSSTNRTVTLPTAADNNGRVITIKKTDSGTGKCTIDGENSEMIDGVTTLDLLAQYDFAQLQCDGTGWHVINKFLKPVVVICRQGGSTALGSLGNNSAGILDCEVKVYDTHNAVTVGSSWRFTAPRDGVYQVNAAAEFGLNGNTFNGSEEMYLYLYKDGSITSSIAQECPYPNGAANSSSFTPSLNGATAIFMTATTYLDIRLAQSSGGTLTLSQNGNTRISVLEVSH